MLKKLRSKKFAKRIWIILAAIIVPAFIFWGFGGAIRSKQENVYVGKIFGKNISASEFADALQAERNQAIMQFGDKFFEIQKFLNLESQGLERLILLYEAKKQKLNASDKEVMELIESYPFFQRKGQFDNSIYNQMLQYVFRTQPRAFEEQTRQNLILSKLYNQVTNDVKVSEEEIKKEYRKANEEISLYYIASSPSDFTKEIAPSGQDLKNYYDNNKLQFKQPVTFNIDYVSSDSEAKIKEAFILLNKKIDPAKLAKDLGISLKETGPFGQTDPIPGIGWSPEVSNMILKLKIGEFTKPLFQDKTYFILILKERKEPQIPNFEKIQDKVKEAFIKEGSKKIAKEKIEDCLKKLKGLASLQPKSLDLDKIAKECGLKSASAKPFKFKSYIEGVGASDDFWLAAQGLKENELSEIFEMPSGFYIVKLKSRTGVDEKKFESEKKDFAQNLLMQKKGEYFSQFLEELKRKGQ
jgi:peptidyl-prolyl cis-trans isomerase D